MDAVPSVPAGANTLICWYVALSTCGKDIRGNWWFAGLFSPSYQNDTYLPFLTTTVMTFAWSIRLRITTEYDAVLATGNKRTLTRAAVPPKTTPAFSGSNPEPDIVMRVPWNKVRFINKCQLSLSLRFLIDNYHKMLNTNDGKCGSQLKLWICHIISSKIYAAYLHLSHQLEVLSQTPIPCT